KYLNYFFNSNEFRRQLPRIIKKSVNQASFSVNDLKNLKVDLPEMEAQKDISEVLDKAQELIDKRKEQIEVLDELVKSRFIEMFGNFKEQKFVLLKDCTNFIDYRGKTPILSENGIRIINAKSVGNGVFKYINEYISENTYNSWMKRGFPVAGDVLFVTEGHTFGNVCRIPKDLKKFAMGQRIITIQGDKKILNNAFLAQYMQTKAFRVEIDKYKTGSSAQGIRSKELQKILIPVPSIELQNKFEEFVNQVDKLKVGIKTSLKELEDNFNSLMQKAFKGELFN
ncbi:restriction endonuclease subunit S, partial [Clostridioides difficile]